MKNTVKTCLLLFCLLGLPFTMLVRYFGGVQMDNITYITYYLLFVAMAFRYYADVAYKITLNYRRYFCYYLFMSVGYGVGAVLVYFTGVWPLGLLMGELFGVLYAYIWGRTLRRRALHISPAWRHTFRIILVLCLSEGIAQLIFNTDRLMLKILIDASAVTIYYLATLVGKTVSMVTAPLNGVLIGYLARYGGKLTKRMMHGILLASVAVVALFTGVCVVGGYIMLWLLYPAEMDAVKPYLFIGSLGQVIYFVTGIVTVILIRFGKKFYQVIINGAFGISFFGFGIPFTVSYGIQGFAVAMVISCSVRFALAIFLGYFSAIWGKQKVTLKKCQENEV